MSRTLFALADANNFYCSCERVFRPDLEGKPVVVLSNNDGCVIARSNESKKLGFRMGDPYFKCRELIQQHGVSVFSSNYALYASLSDKMHSVLAQFTAEVERYSIDEAFLQFPWLGSSSGSNVKSSQSEVANLTEYASSIKGTVRQWVGIPVSIGLACTKTLAKLANERAKKDPQYQGVLNLEAFTLTEQTALLESFELVDIWGIGRRKAAWLLQHGITNARQLRDAPDKWVLQNLTITGLRTVWELRGHSCIPLELAPSPRKSVCCAKSFGRPVESQLELREAVATYTSRVAEKLRKQELGASVIQVFLHTNFFRPDQPQYQNSATLHLPQATSFTSQLVEYASAALAKIYRPGYQYKKVGILLTSLSAQSQLQPTLWSKNLSATDSQADAERKQKLMVAVDSINTRFGRDTIKVAAAAGARGEPGWKMQREQLSPAYTTRWNELLTVKA